MDTIYQSFQLNSSGWLPQTSQNSYWTREENKLFESALAIYDKNTADRWEKVAEMIPGKSVSDVINQYKVLEDDVSDIEAGLFPGQGYHTSSFTLDLGDDRDFDALRKKSSSRSKSVDYEKKKGVPWTEDEHRQFLMGLLKHGKGDWRSISRNFVVTKTPTQVASHAQKYFLRLNSGLKDKRRPSIHDITTTNLTNSSPTADDSRVAAFDQFVVIPPQEKKISQEVVLVWDRYQEAPFMGLESDYTNLFLAPTPCDYLYGTGYSGLHTGPHTTMFEVQSARQRIRG